MTYWKVISVIVGSPLAVVMAFYTLVGPPWPTDPTFSPGPPSYGSSFDIPFTVENRSVFFPIHNFRIQCVLLRLRGDGAMKSRIQIADGLTIDNAPRITARGTNRIDARGTGSFVCPLRGLVSIDGADAADAVKEAQVGFVSQFTTPYLGDRKNAKAGPFTLITTTTPPHWASGIVLK